MFLILVFVLMFVVFSAFFFAGTVFAQGYIYTQPSPGLSWRAPAAAGVMAAFYTFWCLLITLSDARPGTGNNPYDTIGFSPRAEMFADPAPKLVAIRANGTKSVYHRQKNERGQFEYVDDKKKNYNSASVIAFEIEYQGATIRFERGETEDGGNPWYQSADGWIMQTFEGGPTGIPTQWRTGRFLGNIVPNLAHGAVWFLCLWLLLQFRVAEALGFAVVLWLIVTVVVSPTLLDRAAAVAAASRGKTP